MAERRLLLLKPRAPLSIEAIANLREQVGRAMELLPNPPVVLVLEDIDAEYVTERRRALDLIVGALLGGLGLTLLYRLVGW